MLSPSALGMLVTTRRNLATSLAALKAAQEAELEARAEQAKSEERTRISQEIHDAVGHHATLIAVEAAALATTTVELETKQAAERIRAQAKASLTEMRTALGLVADIQQGLKELPALITQAKASGMSISYSPPKLPTVPKATGQAIFRIVRESLTNAAKHAPGAPVIITITDNKEELTATITSGPRHPAAPAPTAPGQGLTGMADQATAAGGYLDTATEADGMFTVSARFPTGTPPKVAPPSPTNEGTQKQVEAR
jgi:signal transduction histidine kinase